MLAVDRRGAPLHRRPAGSALSTWAVTAAAVLIAAPIVIGRQAPDGRHAVVVAVDAATGDVRWRVTTPAGASARLAVTGDVVTMLTVGGDTEPCENVLRRLTLGVAEGTDAGARATGRPRRRSTPPSDYTVRDGYLIHLDGATERLAGRAGPARRVAGGLRRRRQRRRRRHAATASSP